MTRHWRGIAVAMGLLAAPLADAHIVNTRLGDFFVGALHPLTDPIDWAAWVALALFGASCGRSQARSLIVTVPLALLAGWLVGRVVTVPTLATDGVPLLAIGGALALRWPLPFGRFMALAALTEALRGAANVAGVQAGSDLTLYAAGLSLAGYAVITLLAALADRFLAQQAATGWRVVAARIAGSWITAVGALLLSLTLRPILH
jgi:hydrogenase/urease accessory protein HupE